MKRYKMLNLKTMVFLGLSLSMQASFAQSTNKMPAPTVDGIEFPAGYQDWKLISVTNRDDNKTLRAVLGNDAAIKAIEEGKTNPWPDGAALGKIVWKKEKDPHWPTADVPGKFVHAEFMFKDSKKWADTHGWGWARWVGMEQKPFADAKGSAHDSCIACHTPVKNQDWVFHKPALLPSRLP